MCIISIQMRGEDYASDDGRRSQHDRASTGAPLDALAQCASGTIGDFQRRPSGECPGLLQVHGFLAACRRRCVSPSCLSCCMHHERMARAPLHAYLLTHRQERLSVPREHVHHPTPSLTAHDARCIADSPCVPSARQELRSTSTMCNEDR